MMWIRAASRRCLALLAGVGLTLAAGLGVTPSALAQGEDGAKPPPAQPVLAFEHAGLTGMFPDERDAGLVRAISMLGARLKELKADPDMDDEVRQVPDQAIDLLTTVLTDPMRMGVTLGGIDEQTRMPRFGIVVSFDVDDQAGAASLDEDVEHIRAMTGMRITPEPSTRFAGMHDLALPFGMLSYGPRRAADGWHYEILFGDVENPDAVTTYLPATAQVQTVAGRGMLDLAALTPVSEMLGGMLSMFAPQGATIMQQFRDQGFVGDEAMRIEVVSGYTRTEGVKRFTMQRAGRYAGALHLSRDPLTNDDLGVVPADATVAQVRRVALGATWQSIRTQLEQAGEAERLDETLARFKEETGVDVEGEIIASLGDTVAGYLSDSTGGGSLLSGVVAVKLKDPKTMQSVLARLSDKANRLAAGLEMGPGSLHLSTGATPNGSMTTVRVRGLPMPIEPSFSVAGNWLVVGATRQACSAAAEQASHSRDGGLRANPRFASAYPADSKPTAVDFIDTQRTLRSGYATLSLLTTALSNFVTSPEPGGQDPGQILLPYNDLAKNCRPIIGYSHWVGDDLIMEVHGDRSILVNAAGVLGVGDAGSLIMGAIIGGGIAAAANEQHHEMEWLEHEEYESEPDSDDVEY